MSDFSLHNHSRWSDGKADMESMCRAARAAGVRVFGISDHYVRHPEPDMMPISYSIDLSRLGEYCAELERLKNIFNAEDFTLLGKYR